MGVIDINFLNLKTKLRISGIEDAVRRGIVSYNKKLFFQVLSNMSH
jgi:hypothetical protein